MPKQFNQEKITINELHEAFTKIDRELSLAVEKFPEFPCDPLHAISIMAEESGEAVKSAVDWAI